MYCKKCGAQVFENTRFCPNCNMVINGEQQNVTETSTYEGPMGTPAPALLWGILGIGFSLTFWFSILGLIFSAIGICKAKRFHEFTGGAENTRVNVGRRLSIAGIIVSCVMIALLTAALICMGLEVFHGVEIFPEIDFFPGLDLFRSM